MSYQDLDSLSHDILSNIQTAVEKLYKDIKGDKVEAALAKGRVFELASLPQIAVEFYSSASAQNPHSAEARARLVTGLMKAGKREAALEQAVELATTSPEYTTDTLLPNEVVSSFALLGDAYALNGNPEAAEEAYMTALKKDEKNAYAAGRLANLALTDRGRKSGGNKQLAKLSEITAGNPRFADVRSVARMAAISPEVASSISITPLIEILQIAVPGRPFIVEGKRLRAESVLEEGTPASGAWQYDLKPDLDGLTDEQKGILGDRWMEMGREEHASVASFSKFVSQLMALGAPAELVEFGIRSMQDEAEHAKMCFGVASAAYGRQVMVGAIDMSSSQPATTDPWSILYDTIIEGCVGETISTAIAVEAIRRCENDVIKNILGKVAQDESNHAKLAWSFCDWMLRRNPELIAPVEALFTAAEAEIKRPKAVGEEITTDMASLVGYGILWEELAHEQTYGAFFNKVLPRAKSMLARAKAEAASIADVAGAA